MTPLTEEEKVVNLCIAEGRKPTRVKLTPWKHGKRDPATARAVFENVRQTTPPLVIPWHPNMEKIEDSLRHHRAQGAHLGDLYRIVDMAARHVLLRVPAVPE